MVKEILDRTVQFFRDKKLDSPRLDAELLIAKALGYRRIDLYLKFDQPLKEEELVKCRDVVRRRSQGEPVAYILGEKDFYGTTFQVDSRVLIPRPETELLAEAAVEHLNKKIRQHKIIHASKLQMTEAQTADSKSAAAFVNEAETEVEFRAATEKILSQLTFQVLDLGSGSGCLGLTIAKKIPGVHLTLVDISEDALEVAKKNAEQLGLTDRCEFILSDAASVDLGSREFDMIVANPPYIAHSDPRVQVEVAKFEPKLALYSGNDGLAAIAGWAEHSVQNLKSQGWIGFEFGVDQGPRVLALFELLGLEDVQLIKDLSGRPRHAVGLKGSKNG